MRQYLKVDEKWKDWENLEMQWIHHHNPDLVVLDANGKAADARAERAAALAADEDAAKAAFDALT